MITAPMQTTFPGDWERDAADPALPLGILAGLSDQSLSNLAAFGQYDQVPVGTMIIKEGEMQDRFYVVVAGKLAVTRPAVPAARKCP